MENRPKVRRFRAKYPAASYSRSGGENGRVIDRDIHDEFMDGNGKIQHSLPELGTMLFPGFKAVAALLRKFTALFLAERVCTVSVTSHPTACVAALPENDQRY